MNDTLPPSLNRFAEELDQAIRRELDSRRDRRIARVLGARPRLLAGTTVGAAGTATVLVLVLSAAGSPPAFAVTHHRNGSYSVTLRALNAIPAANAKLARLGVHARFERVGRNCTANALPVASNAPSTVRVPDSSNNITIPAHSRTVVVIAAWRKARAVHLGAVSVPVSRRRAAGNSLSGSNGRSGNSGTSTASPAKSVKATTNWVQIRCAA